LVLVEKLNLRTTGKERGDVDILGKGKEKLGKGGVIITYWPTLLSNFFVVKLTDTQN
jgi:hypothetical protein